MPVKPWTGPPPFSGAGTVFGARKPKRTGRLSRKDAERLGLADQPCPDDLKDRTQ